MYSLCFSVLALLTPASFQESSRSSTARPALRRDLGVGGAQDEMGVEQDVWKTAEGSSDPQAFKTYLEKFPRGRFRDEARKRLGELLGEDYATLFTKRVVVYAAWTQVERLLERRADLIPVLVSTLQNAGVEEREVFGQLAVARARLLQEIKAAPEGEGGFKTPEQRRSVMVADESLVKALGRLRSLPAAYPQLLSNELYVKMQDEWAGMENRTYVAREDYNIAAREYNLTRLRTREANAAQRLGFPVEPTFNSAASSPSVPEIEVVPPV